MQRRQRCLYKQERRRSFRPLSATPPRSSPPAVRRSIVRRARGGERLRAGSGAARLLPGAAPRGPSGGAPPSGGGAGPAAAAPTRVFGDLPSAVPARAGVRGFGFGRLPRPCLLYSTVWGDGGRPCLLCGGMPRRRGWLAAAAARAPPLAVVPRLSPSPCSSNHSPRSFLHAAGRSHTPLKGLLASVVCVRDTGFAVARCARQTGVDASRPTSMAALMGETKGLSCYLIAGSLLVSGSSTSGRYSCNPNGYGYGFPQRHRGHRRQGHPQVAPACASKVLHGSPPPAFASSSGLQVLEHDCLKQVRLMSADVYSLGECSAYCKVASVYCSLVCFLVRFLLGSNASMLCPAIGMCSYIVCIVFLHPCVLIHAVKFVLL
ncbi:hypothetical protein BS78_10G052300 [Paspalum vaginatum]|nr:hypothetical protein BS78_10G052300 [Paspalum vaginatum]